MHNFKNNFPALRQNTYLNTAASGLLSEELLEFRQEHDLDFLIGGSLFREKTDFYLTQTREALAGFFKAKPQNTALVPNFTFGLNLLLEGMPKKAKILLLENDYPDIYLSVETRDFDISYAKIDENLEANIEAAVTENQSEYFIFSIVQWINGVKIDLNYLHQLKEKFPQLILVADGTQYCGTENFDFENSALDVLGASAYKWLNAGYGTAFFLFKEAAKNLFKPKALGFGSTMGTYKEEKGNFIGKLEPGHLDTLNFGSLSAAINQITEIGLDTIENQIKSLAQKAKIEFQKLHLLEDTVVKRKIHSSIFNLKGDDALFQKLQKNNIVCSQRGSGIRVSFHYFNTEEDIRKLLDVLKA